MNKKHCDLSPTLAKHLKASLARLMEEQKPFLRYGYSIRDLAGDLHVPAYQLSAFLNRELGTNFNTYLNHFRVWHCEELIQKGLVSQQKLEILAMQCGFGNRNSLTSAFKKFTGFTPSRYQRGWARLLGSEMTD